MAIENAAQPNPTLRAEYMENHQISESTLSQVSVESKQNAWSERAPIIARVSHVFIPKNNKGIAIVPWTFWS